MKKLSTITVAELIEALQGEDPNALVLFASNYGDYHRTRQVHAIAGDFEEVELEQTAYSDSGFAVARSDSRDEDEDEEDEGGDYQPYLVIR
jgi:hypothetical protein